MAKGDHIYISLWINNNPFTHHGIDCGDGNIIHYDGQRIDIVSKTRFAQGKTISVREYGKCNLDDVVVQIAKSKLYEEKYHVIFNNCEHFASYCKTSKHESEQVNRVGVAGGGAVAAGVVGFGTKVATDAATKAAIVAANKSVDPISKVLINIGLKQAPRAAIAGRMAGGIASVGGLVSGIATDMVVEKILEDNPHLTEHEREARKSGRNAAKLGTIAGGLAGGAAAAMIGGAAIAAGVAAPAVLGIGTALGAYHLAKANKK